MKLVIGLGNPGGEYRKTRHNAGFIFLNFFLSKEGLSLDKKKFKGEYIDYVSNKGNKVIFLQPQTYMNLSGDSVIDFIKYFKIDIKDILVIYDDLDLDVGKIRIRSKGGSGGHNGIKSIIARLGSEEFKRIRIGIGKDSNIPVVDYVLSKFSDNEMEILNKQSLIVNQVINDFINDIDFHVIESKYN